MRTIGVVTGARSDYGIYLPLLRRMRDDRELEFFLYVAGMHLSPEFGSTADIIERDGFAIAERIEMLVSSDTPGGLGKSIGLGVIGFAQAFSRRRPDILVVLGDRFEMHAAALAALPFKIPVAHLHGGELTEGAIDDALRHGITKMSHLHFVATDDSARRVRQLGEESWRVTVCGAPSLDHLNSLRFLDRPALEKALGFQLTDPSLLVTFHSASLEYENAAWQGTELLAALRESGAQVIFTLPNADPGGRALASLVREYLRSNPSAHLVENLGTELYFSLLRHVSAMVGNSSSGIIEAPSFGLPVVNCGLRQAGRVRGSNVIDVGEDRASISEGIALALSPKFRASLLGKRNPYSSGREAAPAIIEVLKSTRLGDALVLKKFVDLPLSSATVGPK